ncbi:MAG: serine/threonine protein kinase [Planctomycetia bacterium]|nr:serine/threonine protein kinase [Planctomycetia bacterium]
MTATRLPVVPGYEIRTPLGAGGMGAVYQARQQALDRWTAIKFMHASLAADPVAVARFLREARATARMAHPAIVQIHDVGQVDGLPYLVMEYIEGLDLTRLTAQRGPLPLSEACRTVRDVALGLQHAHERGLVHRDIKPSNLMVLTPAQPQGRPGAVKILDFGLARLHDRESDFGLTHSDQPLGTPDFIAPEQIDDPRTADARSDLYSLGCTFYFLLTGQAPFAGGSLAHKLDGHRWAAPPSLDALRPGLPPELAAIVQALLAKQPEQRPISTGELAAVLDRLLADLPEDEPSSMAPTMDFMTAVTPPQGSATDGPCRRLHGHSAAVTGLAFCADGSQLASGSLDGTVLLWDAFSSAALQCWTAGAPVLTVALSPSGQHLLAGLENGRIAHWDVQSGRCLRWLEGHRGAVRSLALLPDGQRLLSAGDDQTLRLWRLSTGKAGRGLGGTVAERHWGPVLSLTVSADGQCALSGGQDCTARWWNLPRRKEVRCFREHAGPIRAVALSPDGQTAISVDDQTIILWATAPGRAALSLPGAAGTCGVAFTPEGNRVVAGGANGLLVWELSDGALETAASVSPGSVVSLAVSPTGTVATGDPHGILCIRSLAAVESDHESTVRQKNRPSTEKM